MVLGRSWTHLVCWPGVPGHHEVDEQRQRAGDGGELLRCAAAPRAGPCWIARWRLCTASPCLRAAALPAQGRTKTGAGRAALPKGSTRFDEGGSFREGARRPTPERTSAPAAGRPSPRASPGPARPPPARSGPCRPLAAGGGQGPVQCRGSPGRGGRSARPPGCGQRQARRPAPRRGQTDSPPDGATRARAAAAQTRTNPTGSCRVAARSGMASSAAGPIPPRAYAPRRRRSGSLLESAPTQSAPEVPR